MVETHPEKRLIGYVRVSTYGRTLDSQLEQLRGAGCSSRKRIVDAEAQFRSLAEPWADTATSTGRLMLAAPSRGRHHPAVRAAVLAEPGGTI